MAALFASPAQVKDEAEALWERWKRIVQSAQYAKAPQMLFAEPSMLEVLIRDYSARHDFAVESNVPRPASIPEGVAWQTLTAIELEAAWRGARIEEQLKRGLDRRVELTEGGSLVIDEREALQTIDVNSGRNGLSPGRAKPGAYGKPCGRTGDRAADTPSKSKRHSSCGLYRYGQRRGARHGKQGLEAA